MQYQKEVLLKNGQTCLLRNATPADAEAVLENFLLTHRETDYLLTNPDEPTFTPEQEAEYLKKKERDGREAEICAFVEGRLVGTAGVNAVGAWEKVRHRAEFGVAIEKSCWGLGIGRALTAASIECAKMADYVQLELDVVAENFHAIKLYESLDLKSMEEIRWAFIHKGPKLGKSLF